MEPNPLGEHFDHLTTLHESGNPEGIAIENEAKAIQMRQREKETP